MNPEVSICCPIYNEEQNVAAFLRSLLADLRTLECSWELLLCLSGCTDRTASRIVEEFSQVDELKLILEKERKGKANAVNKLRSEALADVLIFTDSDTLWQIGACNLLMMRLNKERVGIVAGRISPLSPGNSLLDRVNILGFEYWCRLRVAHSNQGQLWSISGQIYAIKKSLMNTIPDSIINEDAFLGKWVKDHGHLVIYEPRATVLVDYPRTWRDFFIQKVRNRVGWLQLNQRLGKEIFYLQYSLRQMVWKDIISLTNQGKIERIILLIADTLCYIGAWIRFLSLAPSSLVKWQRISQDLERKNERGQRE